MTLIDSRRRLRFTRDARARLRSILALQKADLVFGICPHTLHPCQKQPSTKMASFFFTKNTSGLPKTSWGCRTQPFNPALTSAILNLNSVDLLFLPRIELIILDLNRETLEKTPFFNLRFSILSIELSGRLARQGLSRIYLEYQF